MSADTLDLDDAERGEVGRLAVGLHAVPMTVDEIVRILRGAGHDVEAGDVEAMLRSAGVRPRNTPFSSVEIRDRARKAAQA